jgi:glycerate-2-kinase
MAVALESILNNRITDGLIVTNALLDNFKPERLEIIVGGHPYPNEGSWQAANRAIELVGGADDDTLIIYLISGGGSSLFERPIDDDISLGDLRKTNEVLVKCGARIREINTIRKHLSAVKGGRLAMRANGATQISFYISDVNSDELSTIASDPSGPDDTTLEEFYSIVEKYRLLSELPENIAKLISEKRVGETPKHTEAILRNIKRVLLMDNRQMLKLAADLAAKYDFSVYPDFSENEEYYRTVADRLLLQLKDLSEQHPGRAICLITGGEVSCPVKGDGIGGRNQEFVLYCATRIKEIFPNSQIAILSAGTDGIDGNSIAAGAVVDNGTISERRAAGFSPDDFLRRNDGYHYFQNYDGLIVTGPTGTNVRDLRLFISCGNPDMISSL